MSLTDSCARTEPSTYSTIEWTIDCGWMTTSIRSAGDVEEVVRLDDLEPLVHHGGRVDGDLRRPSSRSGERGRRSTVIRSKLSTRPGAERPARRGQDDPPRPRAVAGPQRLVDRVVLAVDREDSRPGGARRPRHHARRRRRGSPCSRGRPACRREGGERRREPDRADDAGDDDVGLRLGRDLDEPLRPPGDPRFDRELARGAARRLPGSATETRRGRWRRTWSASRSMFRPAARATTRKRSGKASTTSRVETPIEPVEPRTDTPRAIGPL